MKELVQCADEVQGFLQSEVCEADGLLERLEKQLDFVMRLQQNGILENLCDWLNSVIVGICGYRSLVSGASDGVLCCRPGADLAI